MEIINKKTSSLIPYEKNQKKHPPEQIDKIKKSIEEFGFNVPILVDKDNMIIAGHGRFLAAVQLGMKEIPCIVKDNLTESQIKAYRIMDNKSAESEWDFGLLKEDFLELIDNGFDIEMTGFDQEEVREIMGFEDDKELEDPQVDTRRVKTDIKRGDIIKLGEHRVMCGDATYPSEVDDLMNGQKVEMTTTDPPYNYKEIKSAGIFKKQVMKVAEDIKEFAEFNPKKFLELLPQVFDENMSAFIFCNKDLIPNYLNYAISKKYNFNVLSWHKKTFIPLGGSHHYPDTEYCIYISKKPVFNQGLSSEHYQKYWVEDKDTIEKKSHPTAKPIKILALHIKLCSNEFGNVLDLFGGSGSTLIACEQLNRKCFMMEIDPKYCEVICQRWEKLTGNKREAVEE